MKPIVQLIWTGNDYEIAENADRVERPDWPVQDAGARWHYEKFDGQMACFRGSDVFFGFEAEEVPKADVPRDEDDELNLNDLFGCNNGKIYRAI